MPNHQELFKAIETNNIEEATNLIESDSDVHRASILADGSLITPLIFAIKNDRRDIVALLLKHDPNIYFKMIYVDSPLFIAAQNGNIHIVRLLLKHGQDTAARLSKNIADLHAANDHGTTPGTTPLMIAAQNGHKDVVNLLILGGATIDSADLFGNTALTLAAQNGHKDVVELLLNHNANITAAGSTPLTLAAKNGHTKIVELLLNHNANINASDMHGDGYNALTFAAANGHRDTVELLIKKGADINASSGICGNTPLTIAAQNGHTGIVELLLENGADFTAKNADNKTASELASTRGIKQFLAKANTNLRLVRAIIDNNLKAVIELIAQGANVNAADCQKSTPLMIAAYKGHTDIVALLLKNRANIHAANSDGNTPLIFAAQNGHKEAVELLLKSGADFTAKNADNKTASELAKTQEIKEILEKATQTARLFIAIINNNLKAATKSIAKGANINGIDHNKNTPLTLAARNGQKEMVRLLLEKGANFTAKNGDNKTALEVASTTETQKILGSTTLTLGLITAIINHDLEAATMLIAQGADINATNPHKDTSLTYAAQHGDKDIAELLLKSGANIDHMNYSGNTPLMIAASNGHKEVVELLLAKGADFTIKNATNETALELAKTQEIKEILEKAFLTLGLIIAIKNNDLNAATQFIAKGVYINLTNRDKETPLIHAAKYGRKGMTELLLNNGALINAADFLGNTPLMIAARNGDKEIVKLLLEKGANFTVKNADNKTASDLAKTQEIKEILERFTYPYSFVLFNAIRSNDLKFVAESIEQGADVNFITQSKNTPLMLAAQNGHKEIVELLLKNGAKLAAKNADNKTASDLAKTQEIKEMLEKATQTAKLLIAVKINNLQAANESIKQGADVNAIDQNKNTPLMIAAQNGHTEMVQILLKSKAKFTAKNAHNKTASDLAKTQETKEILERFTYPYSFVLFTAIRSNDLKFAAESIEKGADVNTIDQNKNTPLMVAAQNGKTEMVQILLAKGANNFTAKNSDNKTASDLAKTPEIKELIETSKLFEAAKTNNLEDAAESIANGADVNTITQHGDTALMYAAGCNHKEVVALLLKHGAKVNGKNNRGETPLSLAAYDNYTETMELLLNHGANIDAADYNEDTSLIITARNGHKEAVKLLLDRGANVHAKNIENQTASDVASTPEIKEMLSSRTAHVSRLSTAASSSSKGRPR